MKERVARAVAVIMCFVLLLTSIDVTAYAFSGEKEDESEIVLDSLDEEAIIQGESPVEDIVSMMHLFLSSIGLSKSNEFNNVSI